MKKEQIECVTDLGVRRDENEEGEVVAGGDGLDGAGERHEDGPLAAGERGGVSAAKQ